MGRIYNFLGNKGIPASLLYFPVNPLRVNISNCLRRNMR